MTKDIGRQGAALILVLILTFSALLAYLSLENGHDWGGDFALYLRQAKSLLDGSSGEVLEFNRYAMENSTQQSGANPQVGPHLYPWGFPLLLAPLVSLFGFAIMPAKILIIAFFMLSLLVCYRLLVPRLGRTYSLCLVALLAFNPYLIKTTNVIISDIPFVFFALISLLFIEKTLGYRSYFGNKTLTYIVTGFLIFFAFLVRTNGIVLLGVLGLGHLFKWVEPLRNNFGQTLKREWKELLPYLSFAFFLLLSGFFLPSGSGSHLAFLQRLTPGKLAWNLMYYTELPASFFEGTLFPMLFYGISIPFLLLGLWKRFRQMPDLLYLLYCAASLFVFVMWPPVQGLRFIFSLLPFYLYFVFVGLIEAQSLFVRGEEQGRRLRLNWVPVYTFLVGGMFLFSTSLLALGQYPQRRIAEGPYTPQSQEAFQFLKEHSRKGDVLVFWKPRVPSLFIEGQQALRVTSLSEIMEGKGDFLLYYKQVDFGQLPLNEFDSLKKQVKPVFENDHYVLIDLSHLTRKLPASR